MLFGLPHRTINCIEDFITCQSLLACFFAFAFTFMQVCLDDILVLPTWKGSLGTIKHTLCSQPLSVNAVMCNYRVNTAAVTGCSCCPVGFSWSFWSPAQCVSAQDSSEWPVSWLFWHYSSVAFTKRSLAAWWPFCLTWLGKCPHPFLLYTQIECCGAWPGACSPACHFWVPSAVWLRLACFCLGKSSSLFERIAGCSRTL